MLSRRTATTTAAAAASFAAALTIAAGPAAAQEPDEPTVDIVGCILFGGGETETTAGPALGFVNGWGSGTRGLVTSYIKHQEAIVTVSYNGEPATTLDLSDAYTTPEFFEDFGAWASFLRLPLGDLEAGDTVVVSIELTLQHPTMDFTKDVYNFPPRGNLTPTGTQIDGTCTSTVVDG